MQNYRFYFLVGTKIMRAEDAASADDRDASVQAEHRLRAIDTDYDAIEVWQGARRVCRHERATLPGGAN